MSAVSFGFVALMVLIGGVVALIADNLGRKIGKKRLKLHHRIRPRHTATMFVVGSGLIIPIVTVALVSALSSDVRRWLTEGERAIADVQRLRPEIADLRSTKDNLDKSIQALKGDVGAMRSKVDQATKSLSATREAFQRAENTKNLLDRQVESLKGNLQRFAARSKVEAARLAKASAELDATEKKLGMTLPALREALKQRDDANAYISQMQKDIGSLERTKADLDRQLAELQKSKGEAQADFDRQKAQLQADLNTTRYELNSLKQEVTDAEAKLAQYAKNMAEYLAVNESTRKRRMLYAIGDEVARLVVDQNLSTTQARNQLNTLVRSARVAAEAHGAKGEGRTGAAGFFDQEVDGRIVTAEQQMSEVVSRIAGVPQARILVATSFWNSYEQEPVILEVVSYPNKLSFRAGDVISEVRIDGDLPSGQVIAVLGNWLATQVKEAALKAGMVPATGRADALANVSPEDVFELVSQIKSQSRTARVQAVAFEDIYAAGPLKLAFRIR